MPTEIAIDGEKFLVDGRPTYEGRQWRGRDIEGLLLNSRMVQAVFDDTCEETRRLWAYPDTGVWDPDRNTDAFCAALPEYRRHGLLAVTVGLQGGGSVYTRPVYEAYRNSAFLPDGALAEPWFARLDRVLEAADRAGMVVIVNYFYVAQARRFESDAAAQRATQAATERLLATGRRNILVDVVNESASWWKAEQFEPARVHELIEIVQNTTRQGRRLLAGASTGGGAQLPEGRWLEVEDFHMPHGNGCTPEALRAKLRTLRDTEAFRRKPRPVCANEDSVFVENLEAAVEEGCSWGFYCQGYGSDYQDRFDWKAHPRESRYEDLSGYQTVPVNWGINTDIKRRFFDKVFEITAGG